MVISINQHKLGHSFHNQLRSTTVLCSFTMAVVRWSVGSDSLSTSSTQAAGIALCVCVVCENGAHASFASQFLMQSFALAAFKTGRPFRRSV